MSFPLVRNRILLPALLVALALLAVGDGPRAAGETTPYARALEQYRAGRYDAVIETLAPAAERDAGECNLLGWAYLKTGRRPEAIEAFRRSLALEAGARDSYCGLGFAYLRSGAPGKALESFEKGAAGGSRDVGCRVGLARALEAQGETDRAIAAYRRALALDPANETARARLEALAPEPAPKEDVEPARFFARGDYFWARRGSGEPRVLYVKGVNLSFALPGRYVTEFPEGEELYLDWFRRVHEMGANVVRIYTILPPRFYRALAKFNHGRAPDDRLLLIQGIWSTLPDRFDFRNPAFLQEIRTEIRNAVDVIHGKAHIPRRHGHAHGVYTADVSNDVPAFIFGREWEPSAVTAFDASGATGTFDGQYLRVTSAGPMEAWLAEMLDHLVGYETETYVVQRPVAPMNWPTLDPLHHPSEATFRESLAFRKKLGESVPSAWNPAEVFDDDAVGVDETKMAPTARFHAGLFASYHVYPYYPDFLRNDSTYGANPRGRYFAYLADLKAHYRDMPLLIAEYGVPTSRGVARIHPEGLNHGGLNERQQAQALEKLSLDIRKAGCAGGIVFSWADEWIKSNWMTAGTEDRDRAWYNAMDPEENYGLMAMLPAGLAGKLEGNPDAWKGATLLYRAEGGGPRVARNDGQDGARHIERLYVDSDAGYLYLRLDTGGDADPAKTAYLLAVDTYGDREGDHQLPFHLRYRSPVGFEFVVLLHGKRSRILVDDRYNRTRFDPARKRFPGLSGYEVTEDYRLEENDDGRFTEMIFPHARKFARDGTVFPEKIYNASPLREGRISEDSLADYCYTPERRMIELRIPWGLLYFADPSRRRILGTGGERRTTPGVRLLAVSYRPASAVDPTAMEIEGDTNVTDALPRDPSALRRYTWKGWDGPEYVTHLKRSYFALRLLFPKLRAPQPRLHVSAGYNFAAVIRNHYPSVEAFLSVPGVKAPPADPGDLYGEALGDLARGLVSERPFPVLEAGYLFRTVSRTSPEPRVRKAALDGVVYVRNLLSGHFPAVPEEQGAPRRIEIEKVLQQQRDFARIILGTSAIHVPRGAMVRSQVDRVTRDWLSGVNFSSSPWVLSADRIVPWHEGSRVRELIEYAGARVIPVWGTRARRFGDTWYTPDAEGAYRFPVTLDKVYDYPTNLVLDDRNVVINDTHGISALAWDSLGADLVVGCGDHPGKVEAAYYLAKRGVNVYMPTDRFLGELIGTQSPGMIIGSAPVRDTADGAVIGDQPISLDPAETVVVSNSTRGYPLQYYDTPHRYFEYLQRYTGRRMHVVPVDVPGPGKAGVVVEEAKRIGAKLIGIRVSCREEHDAVARWLAGDRSRRALLFHTAAYPEGYRLFFEFPEQTSFGDIHPRLESD